MARSWTFSIVGSFTIVLATSSCSMPLFLLTPSARVDLKHGLLGLWLPLPAYNFNFRFARYMR